MCSLCSILLHCFDVGGDNLHSDLGVQLICALMVEVRGGYWVGALSIPGL